MDGEVRRNLARRKFSSQESGRKCSDDFAVNPRRDSPPDMQQSPSQKDGIIQNFVNQNINSFRFWAEKYRLSIEDCIRQFHDFAIRNWDQCFWLDGPSSLRVRYKGGGKRRHEEVESDIAESSTTAQQRRPIEPSDQQKNGKNVEKKDLDWVQLEDTKGVLNKITNRINKNKHNYTKIMKDVRSAEDVMKAFRQNAKGLIRALDTETDGYAHLKQMRANANISTFDTILRAFRNSINRAVLSESCSICPQVVP